MQANPTNAGWAPSVIGLLLVGVFGGGAAAASATAERIERSDPPSRISRIIGRQARVETRPVAVATPIKASSTARTAPPKPVPSQATSRPAAPAVNAPLVADRTALLIGVNNAPDSSRLEGSVTDAQNTLTALLGYGFDRNNIDFLADPSRARILEGLRSLAARTSGDGIAVFLLATHSRREGGSATFATGGGGRISANELAAALGRVPGKLVSLLPTCFSSAYKIPGVVGTNRIAVFSSAADEQTYQVGSAGSWLVIYMVRRAMVEKRAPDSIEDSFNWAKEALDRERPERSPTISDGIAGDVALGPVRR